ncbi:unnamed protein product [Gongylonema pulchrum]|uniref:Telomere_reg-2 domain-containing protein n=1 Tax=Gongylonema pulchrum TaxID=637853 RepID=A0A183DWP6_9BILA|nr:unnamed protein product [Gongylonema pulchrum]
MYITEVLSNWLSLPGELHFEYPPNRSEFIADLERIVDDKDAKEENVEKSFVGKEQESGERRPVALEVEKNIEYDEFPYRHVEAPHYIRDCIEQLNEKEDYAKFEAAFHALDPLIRRRAIGYDESAKELLWKLIELTDRFRTENFQEKRLQLIVSCLLMSPHLGSVAVDFMFSRRFDFNYHCDA